MSRRYGASVRLLSASATPRWARPADASAGRGERSSSSASPACRARSRAARSGSSPAASSENSTASKAATEPYTLVPKSISPRPNIFRAGAFAYKMSHPLSGTYSATTMDSSTASMRSAAGSCSFECATPLTCCDNATSLWCEAAEARDSKSGVSNWLLFCWRIAPPDSSIRRLSRLGGRLPASE